MRTATRVATALLVLAVTIVACSGDRSGDDPASASGTEDGDEDVQGEVTILHGFTSEADLAGLDAVIDAFEAAYPRVAVSDEGTNDFESLARARVGSSNPPDVIVHPQPGLLEDFVDQQVVVPLDFLDRDRLEDEFVAGLLDLVTFDSVLYAMPLRLSVKSLVWFNVGVWSEEGYEVPADYDDLLALTEQIAAETELAPWCIGIEAGSSTGWPATDWVEDILLRTIGPEQYDRWVAGELDFASPEVQGAIETYMAPIWTTDAYVAGGTAAIVHEPFGTSAAGIVGGRDADCVLHRQATFIEGFIADLAPAAEFGTDYDFFVLPPIDPAHGTPALGGADLAALYADSEAARAFMRFLAHAESGEPWARVGGFMSPFTTFDTTAHRTASTEKAAELLAAATSFRFDGSDLMPGDVGSSSAEGSFWLEMVRWIAGDQELGESLANIDARYDQVEADG